MKTIIAIATLWLIAIAATFFITRDTGLFTYLGPVYFICMVGSIIAVRKSRGSQKSRSITMTG